MIPLQNTDTYKHIDNKNSSKAVQKSARMPKKQAQSLAQRLKIAAVVASIVSFGFFGGLIAPELQRTTTTTQTTTTQAQNSSSTGSQSTTTNPATSTPSSSQSSTSSQQQNGGYSFGNSNSSTTPGTSTHVS